MHLLILFDFELIDDRYILHENIQFLQTWLISQLMCDTYKYSVLKVIIPTINIPIEPVNHLTLFKERLIPIPIRSDILYPSYRIL